MWVTVTLWVLSDNVLREDVRRDGRPVPALNQQVIYRVALQLAQMLNPVPTTNDSTKTPGRWISSYTDQLMPRRAPPGESPDTDDEGETSGIDQIFIHHHDRATFM
jgi:hypothetical protein